MPLFQSQRRGQRGFTLLELLTVMTILALLATVGIVGYRRHTKAAREAVLKEDLFQLNHCLEEYMADRGKYPTSIGELRDHETHLIPRAMMALQGHLTDFAVFGDDYETPDGTAIRDYIHVTDLAAAHVLSL